MAIRFDNKHQKLVLWGGDLVRTNQDVKAKGHFVPKGTEFRVPLERGKIVVVPSEKVMLCFLDHKQKPGSFLWKTETVEIPALCLQRASDSSEYPTGYGKSLSVLSECSGGMCRPK